MDPEVKPVKRPMFSPVRIAYTLEQRYLSIYGVKPKICLICCKLLAKPCEAMLNYRTEYSNPYCMTVSITFCTRQHHRKCHPARFEFDEVEVDRLDEAPEVVDGWTVRRADLKPPE